MQKLSAFEARKFFDELEYLEPETVRQVRGEDVSDYEVIRELTLKVLKETEAPFVDFYVFEDVVHVLNGLEPDVDVLQGTTPEQIWYALQQIKVIRSKPYEFSHEVKEYIKYIFKEEGFLFLPPEVFGASLFYENARAMAVTGPFPINDETELGAQAVKYARIREYLKTKEN